MLTEIKVGKPVFVAFNNSYEIVKGEIIEIAIKERCTSLTIKFYEKDHYLDVDTFIYDRFTMGYTRVFQSHKECQDYLKTLADGELKKIEVQKLQLKEKLRLL